MILPDMLLDHARRLAGSDSGRAADVDLRRGVSAAYYAVFHDLTDLVARHLIGSSPEAERNKIRRTWSHGEFAAAAAVVVERARNVVANAAAPLSKETRFGGPLVDIAAADTDLVAALRLFGELQEQRHLTDYDHEARFDKVAPLIACKDAERARSLLGTASAASREALFTLLTLRRSDFKER